MNKKKNDSLVFKNILILSSRIYKKVRAILLNYCFFLYRQMTTHNNYIFLYFCRNMNHILIVTLGG